MQLEVARLRAGLRQAAAREAELLESCEVLERDLSSARQHVSSRVAAEHEQLLQRLSAQDGELCRLQARVRCEVPLEPSSNPTLNEEASSSDCDARCILEHAIKHALPPEAIKSSLFDRCGHLTACDELNMLFQHHERGGKI